MTPPSTVASLSFFCLLVLVLPAQHGASSHASYKLGSGQIFHKTTGKSSGNSQQVSTVPRVTTCSSSIATVNNKLPVLHRQSPCSPLRGLPSLTPADVLHRDTSRIRRHFSSQSSYVMPPPAASAPSPAALTMDIFPGDPSILPVVLDHSVFVNYGTPEQRFPVYLDTITGYSQLFCKQCASGSDDCSDPAAFNTSKSLTFTQVPCGSPDCPLNCSPGSLCQVVDPYMNVIWGTFSQDVYTVAPSTVIDDFRFLCYDVKGIPNDDDQPQAGALDLSRDRNSLPSRLSPSSTPAFSYCLPQSPASEGFLFLDGNATRIRDDNNTVYAPLVSHEGEPKLAQAYVVELVGMSLGGVDLPILVDALGNAGTMIDVGTTYTLLMPAAYTALRDAFRKEMSQYNRSVPGFDGFDTCYNFTGLPLLYVPAVQLNFGNGESLVLNVDQMLYYDNDYYGAAPFTIACLAFAPMDTGDDDDGDAFSVIGTHQLASMEVVYDVAGGKVGFVPDRC